MRLRRCFAAGLGRALPFGDGLRAHLRLGRLLRHAATVAADGLVDPVAGAEQRAHHQHADQQEALIAIHANVTKPSFSNHGALHGVIAEHELLSSKPAPAPPASGTATAARR